MIEAIFLSSWVWVLPLLLVLAFVGAGVGIFFAARSYDPGFNMGTTGIIGAVIILSLAGFLFIGILPPYDTSFYQVYRMTGQVEQVESAFSGDEGTMSQTFVARVEGIEEFIRSDDQRFRTVDEGDDVNLVCEKKFAYFQEPWYDCSFGSAP